VVALRACPLKTDKRGLGQRYVTIHIDGVDIKPGMWLYSDVNGVLIAAEKL